MQDEAIAKRRQELEIWIKMFIDRLNEVNGDLEIRYPESIAYDELSAVYWEIMNESIRPRIRSRKAGVEVVVDHHKIASLTELLMVHYRPLDNVGLDVELQNSLNARLAFFVAENIIAGWNPEVVGKLHVSDSFREEHLAWLRSCSFAGQSASVFSNAATWYLVEKIYLEREAGRLLQP